MGSVYLRGSIWWIKYHRAGKPYRESSHSTKKSDAQHKLNLRKGQVAENRFYGLKSERIRFEELAQDVVYDYKVNAKRSLRRIQQCLNHLLDYFGGIRAIDINTDRIRAYIIHRQEEEAANGTINRELTALKRSFNLAKQMTPPKINNVPFIPHLRENNVRIGFFERHEYLALRDTLPGYLKPILTIGYHIGMRSGEITSFQWPQIDLIEGKIILNPQESKTDGIGLIYIHGELLETLRFQKGLRDTKHPRCPWVFFNNDGERILRFDKAWKTACNKVGLEGRLFHDLRRTAVRNMVRAGVPERVAMMISGHKTRSVFERYNIVNEEDLQRASRKVTEYHKNKDMGTVLGTIKENTVILGNEVVSVIH